MFRTEVWLIMFIFGLGVFCTFLVCKVCRLKVYGYGHSTIFQNSLWIVGSFLAVAGFKTTLAVRTINSQLHERKYNQQWDRSVRLSVRPPRGWPAAMLSIGVFERLLMCGHEADEDRADAGRCWTGPTE